MFDQMEKITARYSGGVTFINNRPVYRFNIYTAPERPTDNAKYYCGTPVFEQAKNIVRCMENNGEKPLVKCITTDNKEIWLYF